jgi:ATP-dependent exoDNAse (exonuclease V) beta subunit
LKELTKLENKAYQKIENYFKRIQTKEFPHHIFETKIKTNQQRGSQIKLELLKTSIKKEKNNANLLALKALTQIKNNYQRHKVIQEFMLYNDTSTIATEIPVYLTKEDIKHYQKNKFKIKTMQTPITGHIDFIQIRNNQIHILDYKPEADKAKPMQQLTFYALALSSRLRLPVKQFKCAWFDENNYYEYSPLKSVYARRNLRTQENL